MSWKSVTLIRDSIFSQGSGCLSIFNLNFVAIKNKVFSQTVIYTGSFFFFKSVGKMNFLSQLPFFLKLREKM